MSVGDHADQSGKEISDACEMAGDDVVSAAGVVGATFSRSSDHAAPTLGCRASCVDDMHRSRHARVRSALAHPRA
jgi:hypothetical protein